MPQDRGAKSGSPTSARIETDSLGRSKWRNDRYWGAQTERSRRNFRIGEESMPKPMIRAIALVKKAAALTNREIGLHRGAPGRGHRRRGRRGDRRQA